MAYAAVMPAGAAPQTSTLQRLKSRHANAMQSSSIHARLGESSAGRRPRYL